MSSAVTQAAVGVLSLTAEITGAVALAISFAALGVSLGTLAWSIYSFWLSGARFEATIRHGYMGQTGVVSKITYDPSVAELMASQGYTEEVFGVQVRNIGRAAGTVTGWTAKVSGWGWSNPTDLANPPLPARVDSGETATWWAEGRAVRATAAAASLRPPVSVHLEVELGTGATLRTRGFKIAV
jgi:hypothetical protein